MWLIVGNFLREAEQKTSKEMFSVSSSLYFLLSACHRNPHPFVMWMGFYNSLMLFYLKHVTRTEQKKKKKNQRTNFVHSGNIKEPKRKEIQLQNKKTKKKSNEIVFWTVVLAQSEQMSRIGDVSG